MRNIVSVPQKAIFLHAACYSLRHHVCKYHLHKSLNIWWIFVYFRCAWEMKYPHPFFFLFWEILFWIFVIRICNHVIARNFLTAIILSRLYMYMYVQPQRINGNLGGHSWAREDEDWSRSIIVAVIRAWAATGARVLLNQWRVVREPLAALWRCCLVI